MQMFLFPDVSPPTKFYTLPKQMVGSNSAVSDCFVDHLRLQCMIAIPIKNLPTERLKEYGWIQDTLNMIFLDAFLVATYFTLTSGASLMVGQEGNNNTYFKS